MTDFQALSTRHRRAVRLCYDMRYTDVRQTERAGLRRFRIMKARDLAMRTWERYKQERIQQGRKDLARELLDIMDNQPPDKRVDAVYEFLSNMRKNGDKRK